MFGTVPFAWITSQHWISESKCATFSPIIPSAVASDSVPVLPSPATMMSGCSRGAHLATGFGTWSNSRHGSTKVS